jgi:hypothetical protein
MGNHHVPLQAQVTALLLLATAASAATQGVLPDVLIQAEEKRPVAREKPPLELSVKEDAPLEAALKPEDDVRFRIPAEVAQSTAYSPGVSNSPLVAVPSSNWILLPWKGELARTFRPLKDLTAVSPQAAKDGKGGRWELVVADSGGKVFRKFAGEGLPPERLDFDGKSDGGDWVRAGQAYTPVLTYVDPRGRSRTAVGKPFALAGLSLQDAGGTVISLATRLLFSKDAGGPALSKDGATFLREAAQIVQRHYPGLGLQVTVYHSRKDPAWVQAAAKLCAADLAKRLLLKPDAVAVKAVAGSSDLDERVDLIVRHR